MASPEHPIPLLSWRALNSTCPGSAKPLLESSALDFHTVPNFFSKFRLSGSIEITEQLLRQKIRSRVSQRLRLGPQLDWVIYTRRKPLFGRKQIYRWFEDERVPEAKFLRSQLERSRMRYAYDTRSAENSTNRDSDRLWCNTQVVSSPIIRCRLAKPDGLPSPQRSMLEFEHRSEQNIRLARAVNQSHF